MSVKPNKSSASAFKTQRVADASLTNVLFDDGYCQALYVGSTGTIVALDEDSNIIATFDNVPAGTFIPFQAAGLSSTSSAVPVTAMFNN